MAVEKIAETIGMSSSSWLWDGVIQVDIQNDQSDERVTVKATMIIYEAVGASPKGGKFRTFLQIVKDGSRLTSGGNESSHYIYLVDWNAGGHQITCQTSFNYSESCTLSINGWAICDDGEMAGSAVQGSNAWNLEAHKPPSAIDTDKDTVQMGDKLLIDLIRESPEYTHTLYYTFGTGSEQKISDNVESSYAWDVPDLANLCTNALSGSCKLRAVTHFAGKDIGDTTKLITIRVQNPTTATVEGSEVTMGSKATVNCKRNSQYFTVKLEFQFYGGTESIGEGNVDTKEWTPGYDLAKLISNLPYGTGKLVCTTMNGTAVVGTEESTVRANVPDNDVTRPKFEATGLVLEPVSDLDEKFDGMYIRGRTGIKAQMSATSEYSTIAKYELTVGGLKQEGNPAVIELLVNDGTVEVTAKVTDARGYSRSVKTSVYVYSYRNPKVVPYSGYTEVICQRAASTGELTTNGTFLAIRAGKSFSSIAVNGQEKNSCALRYRWRRNGTAEFSQWFDLLPSGSTSNSISTLIGNIVSDLNASYTVELAATDELNGEHTLMFQIMTKAISFVLYDGEDGAGFGKYPEAPHVVDIASHMTLLVRGKLVVSTADWEDLGLADGVRESVYSYGRKEYSSCYYLVSNGNHVHVAFNCGLTYNGTAVIINKDPIPAEYRPAQSVFSICAMNGRCIAMVSTNPDGFVRLEWVQNLAETGNTGTQEVIWIDGYLDHWT